MTEKCNGCHYMREVGVGFDNRLECRRHAPTHAGFPHTKFDSWCGEFMWLKAAADVLPVEVHHGVERAQ